MDESGIFAVLAAHAHHQSLLYSGKKKDAKAKEKPVAVASEPSQTANKLPTGPDPRATAIPRTIME